MEVIIPKIKASKVTKEELNKIGFRGFKNPKKKDNLERLQWSYFREAGEIINVVLVKKKEWEIEYIFKDGDKTKIRFNHITLKTKLENVTTIIKNTK
jgi:hypothetical protein